MSKTNTPLISVVDDDVSVVEAIVSLMQSVRYKSKGFLSAEEFLCSGQADKTACLILDVYMPDMGGLELQRQLGAGNCPIPIIFMTALDGEDVSSRALKAGAFKFLRKPFGQESLLKAVRSALAWRPGVVPEIA